MPQAALERAQSRRLVISNAPRSIYAPVDSETFYQDDEIQALLQSTMKGVILQPPPRSRSKVAKTMICQALGYQVPPYFSRTKPRFPAQNLDVSVQKALNFQSWNADIVLDRRYTLLHLDVQDRVDAIRVVRGDKISALAHTQTRTSKYQARPSVSVAMSQLVSLKDTPASLAAAKNDFIRIGDLFRRLNVLSGRDLVLSGATDERRRGDALHRAVCSVLGPAVRFSDNGQYPDVPSQLLEVKLQSADTIDLGAFLPDSKEKRASLGGLSSCDVRYAVFFADDDEGKITLRNLIVVTGADFFTYFRRCEGRGISSKLQIHLPNHWFIT